MTDIVPLSVPLVAVFGLVVTASAMLRIVVSEQRLGRQASRDQYARAGGQQPYTSAA